MFNRGSRLDPSQVSDRRGMGTGTKVAVHDLTADAIINRSKASALQALLVDPVVGQYCGVQELLDTMLDYQEKWLGYLK